MTEAKILPCLITEERIDRAQTALEHEGVVDAEPIARAVLNSDDHFVRTLIADARALGWKDAVEAAANNDRIKEYLDTHGYEEITKDERIIWLPDLSGDEAVEWLSDFIRALPSPHARSGK